MTVLILMEVAAAKFSLASGITAMARDGVVAHSDNLHWMIWRMVWQGVALGLILCDQQRNEIYCIPNGHRQTRPFSASTATN